MEMKRKTPSFWLSLFPLILLVVLIISGMQLLGSSPHIPMLMVTFVTLIIALKVLHISWEELEEGMKNSIGNCMPAVMILMTVGVLVGVWMQAGVVPTMIYYGLKIISPAFFLPCALLVCSIVSLAIGSSWTTVATVGVALVGIGTSMGFSLPMIAGCVISGAYFGDKMSPFSDTTNLAPAMVGVNIYVHIRHMFSTTGVTYIICLVLYTILSLHHSGSAADLESMNALSAELEANFNLSPWLLLLPCLVIAMAVMKIPALMGLLTGAVLSGAVAMLSQDASIGAVVDVMHYGFASETGVTAIDELLSKGGLNNMMWTVSLIILAMMFSGVMEKAGMLDAITQKMTEFIHSRGSLVLVTGLTSILMNFTTGEQMLSIIVPGKLYKQQYERYNLAPENLSRVTEDCGTITSSLIPWNGCGAYMIATLGLAPWVYVPFCFFNIINPVVSFIFGYTGFTMTPLKSTSASENEAN